MNELYSGDESDDEPMSMEMLADIFDRSQSHMDVNMRDKWYKIGDRIKQRQVEWKGELKATPNTGKDLHKVFKTVVK